MHVSTDDTSRDQNSNENVRFHSLTTQGIRFHEVELKPKDEPDATEDQPERGGTTRVQAKRGRGRPRKFVNKTAAQIGELEGERLGLEEQSPSVLVREENAVSEAPVAVADPAPADDIYMAMDVDG